MRKKSYYYYKKLKEIEAKKENLSREVWLNLLEELKNEICNDLFHDMEVEFKQKEVLEQVKLIINK